MVTQDLRAGLPSKARFIPTHPFKLYRYLIRVDYAAPEKVHHLDGYLFALVRARDLMLCAVIAHSLGKDCDLCGFRYTVP